MNRMLPVVVLALTCTACGNSKKPDAEAATAASGQASQPAGATPGKPFVLKGVPAGKVVCGYVQDNADPSKCSAVIDAPEGKEVFARAGAHYAQIVKGKVVPSCPTDNVVGTCDSGMGLLTNYSGPKWTAETAKRDCTGKSGQKWVD